jgi:hypothetical protein
MQESDTSTANTPILLLYINLNGGGGGIPNVQKYPTRETIASNCLTRAYIRLCLDIFFYMLVYMVDTGKKSSVGFMNPQRQNCLNFPVYKLKEKYKICSPTPGV